MIASVVVDCKIDSVNRTFDYIVPPCFLDTIKFGNSLSSFNPTTIPNKFCLAKGTYTLCPILIVSKKQGGTI